MSISDKEIGLLSKLAPICEQPFDDRGLINETCQLPSSGCQLLNALKAYVDFKPSKRGLQPEEVLESIRLNQGYKNCSLYLRVFPQKHPVRLVLIK
jgi:hypothetical protein